MISKIGKRDGAGAFDKDLLANAWKRSADAQSLPIDKLAPEKAVDRSSLHS